MNVLELLANRQADNRADYARRRKEQQQLEQLQSDFTGIELGFNAEDGQGYVAINDAVLPTTVITSGRRGSGDRVSVSTTRSGQAWSDAMPS